MRYRNHAINRISPWWRRLCKREKATRGVYYVARAFYVFNHFCSNRGRLLWVILVLGLLFYRADSGRGVYHLFIAPFLVGVSVWGIQ